METLEFLYTLGIDVTRFMRHLWFEKHPDSVPDNWRHNRVDALASGIWASDYLNTVSRAFLERLVFDEKLDVSPGVRQVVRDKYHAGRAGGFLNAPNDSVDPALMEHGVRYGTDDIVQGKKSNRAAARCYLRLDTDRDGPLLIWLNRLYRDKGAQLLADMAQRLVNRYGIQIGVMANGDPHYERVMGQVSMASNGMIAYQPFNKKWKDICMAGSDFVWMMSEVEPSGLPQMEGPRFGTVPIVYDRDGPGESVDELDWERDTGTGIKFAALDPAGVESGVEKAVGFYRQPPDVRERNLRRIREESFQKHNMKGTAKLYEGVYDLLASEI
jgi:starch synthase/alpha-amylase